MSNSADISDSVEGQNPMSFFAKVQSPCYDSDRYTAGVPIQTLSSGVLVRVLARG